MKRYIECLFRRKTNKYFFTYCMRNPFATDIELKKQRVKEICRDIYLNGGVDASYENMFYPIEIRIKEDTGRNVKRYRSWWDDIVGDWNY